MLDVKIRAIVLLLSLLEVLVLVQTSDSSAQYQNVQKKACDSMLVSYAGTTNFGSSTIKFPNLEALLKVRESEKFKSMMTRMSCLMTKARMNNDLEVSQLVDVVNELNISKKDLTIFMETLNATLLREKAINFNVIIHHNESGKSLCG